jgi:predicted DNA binding protein
VSASSHPSIKLREIEFVWEHGCPFNILTREHPGTTLHWRTPAIGIDNNTVVGVFSVNGCDDTESLVSELESYPTIYDVERLVDSTFRAFLDREMVTVPPEILAECCDVTIYEHEGIEDWHVLTASKRVEDFLFQQLNRTDGTRFDLTRKMSTPFSNATWEMDQAIRDRLTTKQQDAILVGLEQGYFEHPRKETAEDIADRLDITASSFLSRLRRGQRHVFSYVFRDA